MSKGSMREQMPITAAWVDELRRVFGRDHIDQQIRRGLKDPGVFYAAEDGHELGYAPEHGARIGKDARGNSVNRDDPDAAPEPYLRRMGEVAWQAALDQQAIDNEKRG
ncbi:hypothetical protein LE191_12615 [Janthinobacterium sp. HSC-3S05]|uniref:hypothetical protein n=1 Tax=Janthinobacterium lividum TaxID=29581 RepID=UPI001CD8AE6F|nr:hypothetical protein [Janthinobacterium lividum]MCA1860946.1 hypothetical protein [Janthinobacterium lividum]